MSQLGAQKIILINIIKTLTDFLTINDLERLRHWHPSDKLTHQHN